MYCGVCYYWSHSHYENKQNIGDCSLYKTPRCADRKCEEEDYIHFLHGIARSIEGSI